MRIRPPSPRAIAWRAARTWLVAVVVVVVGLMSTTKIRKLLRGKRAAEPFRRTPVRAVPVAGSQIATFTDGAELFEDMLAAIDAASERVLLETYILKADATGQRFKDALVRAAGRGVDVHVIYDGFANLVVSPSFLRFPAPIQVLRYPVWAAGLQVFNPRRLGRDHRKILVVDGTVGYVGGYNIGDLYATDWRDTHLRVTGPAVWDLDNAFVDFWNLRGGSLRRLHQIGTASWDPHVRAHRNTPGQLMYPIRGMYLEAIDRAQHHIYITAAYFIPDHDILQGLLDAARRGVDVRILMPEVSNHVVADWLSRGFYGSLLAGGVRILLYQDWMVHAKTATIDGRWSTVGTANIDRLSLTGNYEINLEIIDPGLAAHLEAVFDNDTRPPQARELTRAEWERRHLVARVCELILRPLRPLL
ncbi:phospholipase D domain protein [Aeromicrobium marinum DSM 15272]|uniref:Phospholipase D domain protein n=1 Tax=Aeromicrobium marinum DSM 15272 TaxID=585531 RepID=E2SEE0_9ACTN|nr:phospholipase D-like domain-containing protein [Aeromicrobium marinum]EFQ82417.1 phospholipase D domain protein [Aeromicrobium marinum DSM 15272]